MSPVAPQLGATKELISFIQHLPFVIMQWQTVTCFSWEHVWLHHGSCGWRWRARCRSADTPADTDTADTRPQCTLGSVGSTITSLTPLTLHLRALQTIGHKCAVICAIQYNNISCYEWNLPRELVILMWKTTFIIFSPAVQSFLWCDKNPGEWEDIFHLFVLLSEITYFIILNVFEGTLLDNRNNKWLPVIS